MPSVCKLRVGTGNTTWGCTIVIPDGELKHEGPCRAFEDPRSQEARDKWLREQAREKVLEDLELTLEPAVEEFVSFEEPQRAVDLYSEAGSITPPPGVKPITVDTGQDEHRTSRASDTQPDPINTQAGAHAQVIADTQARMEHGIQKYGKALGPFNGRNSALDAYEEVLDLAAYLANLTIELTLLRDRLGAVLVKMTTGGLPGISEGVSDIEKIVAELGISAAPQIPAQNGSDEQGAPT